MTPGDRIHIDRGDHWDSDGTRIDKPDHPPFIEGDDAPLQPHCFAPLNEHWFETKGPPMLGITKHGKVAVGIAPGKISMSTVALCGWERPSDNRAYPINGEVHCAECLLRQIEISTGISMERYRH